VGTCKSDSKTPSQEVGQEQHTLQDQNGTAGHHCHHAHSLVDDHLKAPIDHHVHWSRLGTHHKKDMFAKAAEQLQHLKKNDSILEKLMTDDLDAKLVSAQLMASVAGHIVEAIEHERPAGSESSQGPSVNFMPYEKVPMRTAKSFARDKAIEKLSKVMMEEAEEEQAKKEEEEEEDEGPETLCFDESPARRHEKRDGYSIFTQKRKKQTSVPKVEGKGKHHLQMIGILEVKPNTPPSRARARSVAGDCTEQITVHEADFIKYGHDMKMLREFKVEPWYPPSPQKDTGSQSSTRAPSVESVHDRLFRTVVKRPTDLSHDQKLPGSRRGSGNGKQLLSVLHSRGPSAPGSRASSRPSSQLSSRQPSRPSSTAPSQRSRPGSARLHGHTAPSALPALPLREKAGSW